MRILLSLAIGLPLLTLPSVARTPGIFGGTILEAPDREANWIYVAGHNGMVRRAEISHARVFYGEEVPAKQRKRYPRNGLSVGAEVRVTAYLNRIGDWRAVSVEIVKVSRPLTEACTGCARAGLQSRPRFIPATIKASACGNSRAEHPAG